MYWCGYRQLSWELFRSNDRACKTDSRSRLSVWLVSVLMVIVSSEITPAHTFYLQEALYFFLRRFWGSYRGSKNICGWKRPVHHWAPCRCSFTHRGKVVPEENQKVRRSNLLRMEERSIGNHTYHTVPHLLCHCATHTQSIFIYWLPTYFTQLLPLRRIHVTHFEHTKGKSKIAPYLLALWSVAPYLLALWSSRAWCLWVHMGFLMPFSYLLKIMPVGGLAEINYFLVWITVWGWRPLLPTCH